MVEVNLIVLRLCCTVSLLTLILDLTNTFDKYKMLYTCRM